MDDLFARHYRTGTRWRIRTGDVWGLVDEVGTGAGAGDGHLLMPGLFDIQVNGFAGVDLNADDLTPQGVAAVIRGLLTRGVTRVLPTIITGPRDRMRQGVATITSACQLDPLVAACVAGIHLEGPFLSPVDGARGVHDPAAVRAPDRTLIDDLQQAADGSVRLVTLAPELDGGIDLVCHLVGAGIAVAIGHTTADYATIRAAADAGATLSTHLGNGCEAQLDRHDNPVLAQLGEDRLTATLIADGHHLPPRVLRTFVRAKGVERVILTSDAMAAAGAPPGRYELAGRTFEVADDQVVRVPGTHMFSGSALTLDAAVRNAAAWCGLPLADAIRLAAHAPAGAFGEPDPDEAMQDGTFVVATPGGTPVHTVVAGRPIRAVAS